VDVNWDFSQFDRDNTDRFQAAAYINNANALAQEIAASPNDEEAAEELAQADIEYGEAKDALRVHDYAGTFENAREAYEQVLAGANDAGVTVEESENGRTADPDFEASSEIPGRYIDRPEPRDPVQPLRTQGAEDIEAGQPQDFSPTAHRLRR
jgi:sugar/nucleoside kinase (ribokinase family)